MNPLLSLQWLRPLGGVVFSSALGVTVTLGLLPRTSATAMEPGQPVSSPALSPANSPAVTDPANEVAPAVIEFVPGRQPLSLAVAMAMEQELKNLMGRLESALLLAQSRQISTTLSLATVDPGLTAALEDGVVGDSDGITVSQFLHPQLAAAQQLLQDWPTLMAEGSHTELKERWVAVRDGLWESFPTDQPYAQAEIRAVWLDRGTIIRARNPEGLAQVFDQLAEAGITTVFFETVNAGYPIYPSRVAPEQNPLTRRWDPLASAVDLAHERGMTLHAWVWVFAAGNQQHNRLLNLPADYPGPLLSRYPSWAGYDNRGNPIPPGQDKPFLDPANPEVRSYLIRLMSEMVNEYDIDGVHLDYIRYPFQDPGANRTYGYGEAARWRFRSIAGVDPLDLSPRPDPTLSPGQQMQRRVLWDRWTEFRIQQVNSFVATLSITLRRQRPDLVMSAAVFAHPEPERLQKIQQDWGTWAEAGHLDWVVLMSYAQDTSRFEQLLRPWMADLGEAIVIPGIRMYDLPTQAILDQMQTARDLPTPGFALFATADLNTEIHTLLAQTQATPSPTAPAQMALDRYQTLQREWHWLLSHQKLWMERPLLEQWVQDVNQLETDFNALLASPSRRGLDQVRQGLTRVQAPLNRQVLIDTTNSAYRLQVWHHRLGVIEQLLRHGEPQLVGR
ncbi:MAG: glycoside hydrolase family 10 protein [Spirulina sp.]